MRGESRFVRNLTDLSRRVRNAKRPLALTLAAAISLQAVSCGTLIHPERVGQARTGPLDPSILVLDGLGVLVFVVPGLVAFVVDFATGAIYLPGPAYYPGPPPGAYPPAGYPPAGAYPPPPSGASYTPRGAPVPMTRIDVDPTTLDKQKIQAVVRAQTGRDIDLDAANVRVQRAPSVDEASRLLNDAQDR